MNQSMTSIEIAAGVLAIGLLIWLGTKLNRYCINRYDFKPFSWGTYAVALMGVCFLAASYGLFHISGLSFETLVHQVLQLDFSNDVDEIAASGAIGMLTMVALFFFMLAKTNVFMGVVTFVLLVLLAATIIGYIVLWLGGRIFGRMNPYAR